MSAIKKSELVQDNMNQTEFAAVNGNTGIAGTIGDGAGQRAQKHSKVNWKAVCTGTLVAVVTVSMLPSSAYAVAQAVTIEEVVDIGSITTQVATIGGGALVLAFGVGGGFRIAQKAYTWVMRKI